MATRYLSTYVISLIFFALLALAFIMLVDPYYVNNTKIIKGFNEIKSEAYTHKVAAKRSLFLRSNYKTLILGNSRADVGFNPLSKNWPQQFGSTFNFGIPGATLERNLSNYYFARTTGAAPTKVILLIDFYNYIVPHKSKRLAIGDENIHPWVDGNFSLTALVDAIFTVRAQYANNPSGMNISGFNRALPYNDIISTEGHYRLAQQTNQRSIQTYANRKSKRDNSQIMHSFDLHLLTEFAEDLSAENIQLYVIFPPYHIDLHTIIEETGLTSLFNTWKKSVTSAVSYGSETAQVWDFAIINNVTAEGIPEKGDTRSKMKWYWEPGHFKSSLGDLIACEIVEPVLNCPADIGQKMSLDSEINSTRASPPQPLFNNSLFRIKEIMP